MVSMNGRLVANVTEPGDVALYAIVLGVTLAVGLLLLGIDALVGRLGRTRARRRLW